MLNINIKELKRKDKKACKAIKSQFKQLSKELHAIPVNFTIHLGNGATIVKAVPGYVSYFPHGYHIGHRMSLHLIPVPDMISVLRRLPEIEKEITRLVNNKMDEYKLLNITSTDSQQKIAKATNEFIIEKRSRFWNLLYSYPMTISFGVTSVIIWFARKYILTLWG